MADKYFEDQLDDEEVLFVFRKHPIVMRKGLVLCMFGPLIGILPSTFRPELGFGWFFGGLFFGCVLGAALFFPFWLDWHFSVSVVTNQRFIQIRQKGFFNRSVNDLALNHIQSMNYKIEGIEATLLGFGTIIVQTYMGNIELHHVHHPAKTQKQIQAVLRDEHIEPLALGTDTSEKQKIDEED